MHHSIALAGVALGAGRSCFDVCVIQFLFDPVKLLMESQQVLQHGLVNGLRNGEHEVILQDELQRNLFSQDCRHKRSPIE